MLNRNQILYKRIRITSLIFFTANAIILSKMLFIQSFKSEELKDNTYKFGRTERTASGNRGKVLDKDGEILAQSIPKYTFWVNSKKHYEKDKIIKLFSAEFDKPREYYLSLLKNKRKYVKIEDGLFRMECSNILAQISEIEGLHYDISVDRFYPHKNLFSQVLGYVDADNQGQFGIEREFNSILEGKLEQRKYSRSANGRIQQLEYSELNKNTNGLDIQLTLDVDMQDILVHALNNGLDRSKAKSASGIILDPFNGDILAMASIPDYDPNNYKEYNVDVFSNRVISESYEPGSTFKLIAMAALLESEKFSPEDMIFCENGKYQILPQKTIHDHEPYDYLSVSEVFIYSSNIGLVKLVKELGDASIYNFARKFGFGIQTGIPLPSESSGLLRQYNQWSRLSGYSISMGQEIAVNTLQLGLAYSAVANGGYLPAPRIIKNIYGEGYDMNDFLPVPIRRVISKNTSKILLDMMEGVVTQGTASKAGIPGYKIGGKTGTAEKFIDGRYSNKFFISSFASIFPIDDPRYVCVISVDSPIYGFHWGNETAAPIVKEIFERIILKFDFEPNLTNYSNLNSNQVNNGHLRYKSLRKLEL